LTLDGGRKLRRDVVTGLLALPLAACGIAEPEHAPDPAGKSEPKTLLPASNTSGLVELTRLDPSIRLDIRYATPSNFTGRTLYSQARAFLMDEPAAALVRVHHRAREEGLGLTLFDAYRPWSVTKALWEATPPANRGFVANPKEGSKHNRGSAVDLSLHDLATGRLVEMPGPYDDFTRRAYRDFEPVSATARLNRSRLERWMEAEGFTGIHNEWWHFDWRKWRSYPILDVPFEALS
jgi:zinc D-Ala-D-Ala dipeptidase